MLATDEVIACFAMYFEGSFAKYRQISHTAYQKQSQFEKRMHKPNEFLFEKQSKFLCLTRGCVLTFSRKKRIINTKRRRFVFFETTINVGKKEVQVYEKPHHYNKP